MKPIGKTIQIFLPDGNPRGIKIAEITNRTVQAIVIPRNLLTDSKHREEVSNVGLYFLFGEDDEQAKPRVYIGEAEHGYERLEGQNKAIGFWKIAVLVVTTNKQNQFTKSDVKFLENLSYTEAKKINRYSVNQNTPQKSFVPEWRQADLLDIFDTMKMLLAALGYPLFEPLVKDVKDEGEEIFYCRGRGVEARGIFVEDGFVVLKDSEMAPTPVDSFVDRFSYHLYRIEDMKNQGVLKNVDGKWLFQSDFLFNSPSMASSCVLQRPSNGWDDWKDENGQTLNKIKRHI